MTLLARRFKHEDEQVVIRGGFNDKDTDIRMTEAKKHFERGLDMFNRWKKTKRNYHMRRASKYLDKARRLVGILSDSDDRTKITNEATSMLFEMTKGDG